MYLVVKDTHLRRGGPMHLERTLIASPRGGEFIHPFIDATWQDLSHVLSAAVFIATNATTSKQIPIR